MGLLDFLGIFNKTADIVKETVLDKDAQNKILENLELTKLTIENRLLQIELSTKTIPWVDALHKMGRQITNYLMLLFGFILVMLDKDLSGPAGMIMGGGNLAYQVIKGKGK